MAKITYTDKEAINIDPSIPAKNKCMAVDLNEIKSVINMTLDTLKLGTDTWNSNITYGLNAIVVYNNEVYENITGTSTTTNPSSDTTNWLKITYDYFMGAVKQLPITALGSYNVYKCDIENINTGFYVVNGIDTEVNLYEGNDFIYTINNFAIIGYTTLGQINIFMNGKVISCYKDNNVWRTTDLFKSYQKLIAVSSSAPSQCSKGDKYFNTSTKQIYEATATNIWSSTGNTPQADIFYVVFDTDSMTIYAYNGTTLVGISGGGAGGESLPVGSIIAFAGSNAPEGYLMCDGSNVSRTTYGELFNVTGTIYGQGDGSTTFGLPNIKGRVLVGLDTTQTEFNTLGKTGGSKYLQAHKHAFRVIKDNEANSGGGLPKANNSQGNNQGWSAWQTDNDNLPVGDVLGVTTGNAGNLQPYIVVNYIIKAHPSAVNTSEVVNEHSTSETDVYSANYVNNAIEEVYSTSEVKTNEVWIDNKPIYRRTFSGTFTHGQVLISQASDLVDCKGWLDPGTGMGRQVPYYEIYQGNSFCARLNFTNNQIKIDSYLNGNVNNCNGKITIYYTKTTD